MKNYFVSCHVVLDVLSNQLEAVARDSPTVFSFAECVGNLLQKY